jgi:CBS domain-containing protein
MATQPPPDPLDPLDPFDRARARGAADAAMQPSGSLLANLTAELSAQPPFAGMASDHVRRFAAAARLHYYAPQEPVLAPSSGVVGQLYWIRRGLITGGQGIAELSQAAFRYEAGDLFPIGAVMGVRPVTATYVAQGDTFCLQVPAATVRELAACSAPFADFLNRRMWQLLELSQRAVQEAYAARTLSEQSLEAPLGSFARKEPLTCAPATPLLEALQAMHLRHVGSVMVVDAAGAAVGILTRHDILGRVTLPGLPLATPIERVMSAPVHSLSVEHRAQDAALLMSRHGVRHVPVSEAGRVVSIVSERDLFAMQRLSLRQVGAGIRAAADAGALRRCAAEIRRFAEHLLGQGVQARQVTELISHLNDLLTERLVGLLAAERGLDLQQACWLAFGSEGRSEQTIATDQDNGLVFDSADPLADQPRWLALAEAVNRALDDCGFPLCRGSVMASNPACCLTAAQWRERFAHWIHHGAPQDLLNASIYFDLRAVAGRAELAGPLRRFVREQARATPRFLKQLADNALRNRAALNWLGGIEGQRVDGREMFDLKLAGTALFVDAARLLALSQGIDEVNTRRRLVAAGALLHVPAQESEAWVTGFEYLQMLRLRVQIERRGDAAGTAVTVATGPGDNPNLIPLDALNDIDRRVLRETLRVARRLQQRLELDYQRG